MANNILSIGDPALTLNDIEQFLSQKSKIEISAQSRQRIAASRQVIEDILKSNRAVYGVNTGFGNFSEVRIKPDTVAELQRRLVLSHAAGVGDPIPHSVVKLMMLLKLKSLALGYSGVRTDVVEMLADMLNSEILPVIPDQGSVGASGDLAPLAHMALTMIGEGEAFAATRGKEDHWQRMRSSDALKIAGLRPLTFQAKEGLAVLNGTQAMTAFAVYALIRLNNLLKVADITGAMTLEALLGTLTPFDSRIQEIRNHTGQKLVAENFRKILAASPIVESHKFSDHKVQDAYSLRCIPQVHGAVRDTFAFASSVLLNEANGVTDNPLVFPAENDVLSGGNFHGAPVAQTADFLTIAITDLASIAERRIEHMLDPSVSQLPAFLTEEGGLNSGFMMAHVTAAALVSESKVLSHPASVDSIPTSANKEDHVSMGYHAARKLVQVTRNLENILAIELLCAAQAIDFRKPVSPSAATGAALNLLRNGVPGWTEDRLMHRDIVLAAELIHSGRIVSAVESQTGPLH